MNETFDDLVTEIQLQLDELKCHISRYREESRDHAARIQTIRDRIDQNRLGTVDEIR